MGKTPFDTGTVIKKGRAEGHLPKRPFCVPGKSFAQSGKKEFLEVAGNLTSILHTPTFGFYKGNVRWNHKDETSESNRQPLTIYMRRQIQRSYYL